MFNFESLCAAVARRARGELVRVSESVPRSSSPGFPPNRLLSPSLSPVTENSYATSTFPSHPATMVSWLAYSTVKLVRIDDKCLGALHYIFMASIALYIGVIKVGRDLGYVAFEDPVGSVRLSLQAPTVLGPHSDPGDPGYLYNFTSASKLGYCNDAGAMDNTMNPLPCKFWGAMLASGESLLKLHGRDGEGSRVE